MCVKLHRYSTNNKLAMSDYAEFYIHTLKNTYKLEYTHHWADHCKILNKI